MERSTVLRILTDTSFDIKLISIAFWIISRLHVDTLKVRAFVHASVYRKESVCIATRTGQSGHHKE